MKVMEALRGRRGVRDFRPEPVDKGVLKELVEAAILAPSYMNLQPWAFAIAADPETVAGLGRRAKSFLAGTLDERSPFFTQRQEISADRFDFFYRAPALIVVCAKTPGQLADMACAMAAQSLMLAAHSMGLGSCWVSFAQPWLDTREGRAALGIPQDYRPIAPIVVGGPAGDPLSPGRFHPEVHWIPSGSVGVCP